MLSAEPGDAGPITIVPFKAEHLYLLEDQDPKTFWGDAVKNHENAEYFEAQKISHTLLRGKRILSCAGIIPQWDNRVVAWAMMARVVRNDYIYIHRAVERWLKLNTVIRIETTVDCNFINGIRWAEMLGFKREGRMRKYGVDGHDHYMYAIVKEG